MEVSLCVEVGWGGYVLRVEGVTSEDGQTVTGVSDVSALPPDKDGSSTRQVLSLLSLERV